MDPISSTWIFTLVAASYLTYKRCLAPRGTLLAPPRLPTDGERPHVCVQIPIYNEPDHTLDCLRACLKIRWPRDRFAVQVLDDSTDETTAEIEGFLASYNGDTVVQHLRRTEREGFKAGALAAGMAASNAEYFAVFDCDFRPQPDFLERAMTSFVDAPDVAAVQGCWTYYNRNANPLARIQATLLNLHFKIEHAGRYSRGLPFNFNGTGGVWRRAAIVDAGGWSASSVAEDLLLSYKAQLKGWRLVYRSDVEAPSALPETLNAFVIQQRRWAKGNGQVLRLLGSTIAGSYTWRWRARLDALFHLVGYGVATSILVAYLLSPLWIIEKARWIATTEFYEPARLLDTVLWTGLMGAFFSLFLHPSLHHRSDSIPSKGIKVLSLLAFSPLLVAFTCPQYWGGVFDVGSKRKQLFFHRTPKDEVLTATRWQRFCCLLMFGFALFCSALSWAQELYVSTAGFFLQAVLLWYAVGSPPTPSEGPVMAKESSQKASL